MIRCFSELHRLTTFKERSQYLKLNGQIGQDTFGVDRYINQMFYRSDIWKRIRDEVILRDMGCDLGLDGYEIHGKILVHHMNPISIEDIVTTSDFLLNPEYLICTSQLTHNAIHYGDLENVDPTPTVRLPNDTCPWRH